MRTTNFSGKGGFSMANLSVRERSFRFSRTTAAPVLRAALRALLALCLATAISATPGLPASAEEEPAGEETVIVVTATRLPQPVEAFPAAVTEIPVEEVRAAGATTVAQALQMAPRLPVDSTGGSGSVVSAKLQGATSTQVQVLVDGRPVAAALSGLASLSLLPLVNVERIEVVHGPASSVYGANAVGGVINVITKNPGDPVERRLDLGAGGFGQRKAAFSTGGEAGPARFLLAASVEASDGWRTNTDSSLSALSGKLAWAALDGEATLHAQYSRTEAGSPGQAPWLTPEARRGEDALNLDLVYRGFGAGDREVRAYYTRTSATYVDPLWLQDDRHRGEFGGLEAHRTWEIGPHWVLLGGDYRADWGRSTKFASDHRTTNLGLYFEDLFPVAGDWSVTVGGRWDAHSVYGQVFSPRVSAVRALGEEGRVWLSAARAFRAPCFQDLYWSEPWMVGDPDLRPETATAFQAGLALGDLEVSAFHKDVKDKIDWVYNDLDGVTYARNLNATRFDGVDLVYRKRLGRRLSGEASYSWLNPVDTLTGKLLPKRATRRGSVRLAASLPGDWQVSAAVKAVGPSFDDPDNTREVPGYTVVNLQMARELSRELSWQIKVENALNTAYEEVYGYPMPGASVMAVLSYRF